MRAYLLDTDFTTIGKLDNSFTRMTVIQRYQAIDTVEMVIDFRKRYANLITGDRFIYLPDEDDSIYLIERILDDESKSENLYTVSGRSVDGFALTERIIDVPGSDYDSVSAVSAEAAIKHYVDFHAGPSASAAREIPNLTIAANLDRGPNVNVSGRYQYLLEPVLEIARKSGLGWRVKFIPGVTPELEFEVLEGVDHTTDVFFDFEYETLLSWQRLYDLVNSKTWARVAGQGELASRDVVARFDGAEPTGFARREAFIDARDVPLGNTGALEQRGDAFIESNKPKTSLETEVNPNGSFRFREHYDIGDIALVRNQRKGVELEARVMEVHKTWDVSAVTPGMKVVLDKPFPSLKDQIRATASTTGPIVDLVAAGIGITLVVDSLGRIVSFVSGAGGLVTG